MCIVQLRNVFGQGSITCFNPHKPFIQANLHTKVTGIYLSLGLTSIGFSPILELPDLGVTELALLTYIPIGYGIKTPTWIN